MGERAGYRVKTSEGSSALLRKQRYWGGDKKSIHTLTKEVASVLTQEPQVEGMIGSGIVALRNDLDLGRMSAALFSVAYRAPFNSIEKNEQCDISDHGITEIELVTWNHWKVNHYPVGWKLDDTEKALTPTTVAEVHFVEGKLVSNGGLKFKWYGPEF